MPQIAKKICHFFWHMPLFPEVAKSGICHLPIMPHLCHFVFSPWLPGIQGPGSQGHGVGWWGAHLHAYHASGPPAPAIQRTENFPNFIIKFIILTFIWDM